MVQFNVEVAVDVEIDVYVDIEVGVEVEVARGVDCRGRMWRGSSPTTVAPLGAERSQV